MSGNFVFRFHSDEKAAKRKALFLGIATAASLIAAGITRFLTVQAGKDVLCLFVSPEQAEMIVSNGLLIECFLYFAIFSGVVFLPHFVNYLIVKRKSRSIE